MVVHEPPLGNQITLLVLLRWGGGRFINLCSSVPRYKVGAEAAPSRAHLVPRAVGNQRGLCFLEQD